MVNLGRSRPRGAAIAALIVAAACNPFGGDGESTTTSAPPTTQPPIRAGASIDGVVKLGALLPLSGDLQHFGPGMRAAVEMAVDEINDSGGLLGKPVELLIEDSMSTAEQATTAARELIDASLVDGFVGPASSLELAPAVLEEALEGERVVCSPAAAAPRLTRLDEKELLFTAMPNEDGQIVPIALALKAAGRGRIAVVHGDDEDTTELSQGLVRELEDEFGVGGFELVADLTVVPGSDTSTAEAVEAAEALKASAPQAVVVFLRPGEASALARAMFDAVLLPSQGADITVVVAGSLATEDLAAAVDPEKPAILGKVQGVRPDVTQSLGLPFDDRLRARMAVDDVDLAAQAYDCTALLALSVIAAGSDDPVAMASKMVELTRGGVECPDFVACAERLKQGQDIDYVGALGLEFNDFGAPRFGVYEHFEFDDLGRIVHLATVPVEMVREDPGPGAGPEPPATTPTTAAAVRGGSPKTTTTLRGALGGTPTTLGGGGSPTTSTTTP